MEVLEARSEEEIKACFPALRELRPHLVEGNFVERVMRQMSEYNYHLVYTAREGNVVAAAGYRVADFLAWGRTFYIDDLITIGVARRIGLGGAMIDWLIEKSKELRCDQLHLDSGVQRYEAHRLYMGRRMKLTSHHFSLVMGSS
jgi:hypothetical protein